MLRDKTFRGARTPVHRMTVIGTSCATKPRIRRIGTGTLPAPGGAQLDRWSSEHRTMSYGGARDEREPGHDSHRRPQRHSPITSPSSWTTLELTYGMLEEGSARIAGLLRSRGIEPGDRVGIMLPNVPYFPVVYYGILRAGGVVVPMNVLLKEREVRFYLEDPGAKLLFAWHEFDEAASTRRRGGRSRVRAGGAGRVRGDAGRAGARPRGRGPGRGRHRRDPLHLAAPPASRRAPSSPTRTWAATASPPGARSRGSPRTTCCWEPCRCSTRSGRPAR